MARYNYGYIDELRGKRKRRKVRIAFLVISSLIVLTIFSVYALFFSKWFLIKEIRITGNKEISEEEIRNLIKPFSNILFAGSESIEHSLQKNFPIIEKVNVDKHLFSKNLTVEINEREVIGIWCKSATGEESDKCFYFDNEGILFKPAPKFSGEVFLTVEDGRGRPGSRNSDSGFAAKSSRSESEFSQPGRDFNLGDSFDDMELLEKINLTRSILDELKFIGYSNFFLPENSFEFWIKTKEGWHIYLDKESDIPTQLVALKKFLDEKLPESRRQNLQYIDLRVNNRIYYK